MNLAQLAALENLQADDYTGLDAIDWSTWYLPASVGAIAGGFAMAWYMNKGPRARGMSLSGLRCVKRGKSKGRTVCRKYA